MEVTNWLHLAYNQTLSIIDIIHIDFQIAFSSARTCNGCTALDEYELMKMIETFRRAPYVCYAQEKRDNLQLGGGGVFVKYQRETRTLLLSRVQFHDAVEDARVR